MSNSKENGNGTSSDAPELPSTAAKQYRMSPLLTALIVKAQREGQTMQHLASVLLSDLLWPDEGDLGRQVESGIQQVYDDAFIGGFVPSALLSASTTVKLFVLFLYRELNSPENVAMGRGSASWSKAIREVLQDMQVVEMPEK